ncbi:MAG: leucine-rich repeat protein [Prevotellaceae bacterium]|jgi:uncharacterized repeat protein (TIGR02543 family)|nr:leucine-rich repeat protein [Prevotellaceae bacterium]
MKTIKFLLPAACLFLSAGATAAPDINASGTTGRCTWSIAPDNKGVTTLTISGNGAMGKYDDRYNRPPWYGNKNPIAAVVIAPGVTEIGEYAFYCCVGIASVTFTAPSAVRTIGKEAFAGCSRLTSICIPSSVTTIGADALSYCTELGTVNFSVPSAVERIGSKAFHRCRSLTSIILPASVKAIDDYAFFECETLESVTFASPSKPTTLPEGIFANCFKLKSINVPQGVTAIRKFAFLSCSELTSVILPEGLTEIEDYAFLFCKQLPNISIPPSVTAIGKQAFKGCRALSSISIPPKVKVISKLTFCDCDGLSSVEIPPSVEVIDTSAFEACSSLKALTIPASVHTIREKAFGSCTGLTSITNLRETPQAIKKEVFGNVNTGAVDLIAKSSAVSRYKSAPTWSSFRFGKFTYASHHLDRPNTLKDKPGVKNVSHLTLTGVIDARDVRFMRDEMPNLKELDLSSVTISAYTGAEGTVPSANKDYSYSAGYMPEYAFYNGAVGKATLTSVKLPESNLLVIGNKAFQECTGLIAIRITAIKAVYQYAFYGCRGLKAVEFTNYSPKFYMGYYTFSRCTSLKNIVIPLELQKIEWMLFEGCTSLETVVMPPGVKVDFISHYAFSGCSSLASITIPPMVSVICEKTFSGTKLREVVLPPQTTIISRGAFSNCSYLESVFIPSSVKVIQDIAFSSCTSLTSITILTRLAPIINPNVFDKVDKSKCTLTVPSESLSSYEKAVVWRDFLKKASLPAFTVSFGVGRCGIKYIPNRTVYRGELLTPPSDPPHKCKGYKVGDDGWYADEHLSIPWDFAINRVPEKNIKLYPKWTPKVYKIDYHNVFGDSLPKNPDYYTIESSIITLPTPTYAGYRFTGWYDNYELQGRPILYIRKGSTGDTTLYAQWRKLYKVTFELNGGIPAIPSCEVADGYVVPRPADPGKAGYTFGGWYHYSKTGSAPWGFSVNGITKDTTLHAKWTPVAYKIAYVLNGGAHAASPDTTYTIASGAITPPAPVRSGFAFAGWYDAPAGGRKVTTIPTGSTGNTTLYARWRKLYRVTFELNGGIPATPSCEVADGDAAPRPADPGKVGYTFGGWYSYYSKTGSKTDSALWDFGASKVTKDTTLHAKWILAGIQLDSVIVNGEVLPVVNNTIGYTMPCGDTSPKIVALLPSGDTLLCREADKPFRLDTSITATAHGSLLPEACTLLLEKPFMFNDIVNVQLGRKLLMVIKNPDYNGGYHIRRVAWYRKAEGVTEKIEAGKFYYASPSGAAISDSIFVEVQVAENKWIRSCPYVPGSFARHDARVRAVVYPNPAPPGGIVHLKRAFIIGEEADNLDVLEERYATFYLFDVQGRMVHEGKTANLKQGLTMPDIPGVYYFALEGKAGRVMVKIAVE